MKKRTLEDDIKNILALNAHAAETAKRADKKFADLKRKLQAGASTGDYIRDIAILHWNSVYDNVRDALETVVLRFTKGTQVLLVQEEQRPFIHYLDFSSERQSRDGLMPPEDHTTYREYHLRLAVLAAAANYDRKTGALALPSHAYAETRSPGNINKWTIMMHSLEVPKFEQVGLVSQAMGTPKPEDLFALQLRNISPPMKLLVGDEVKDYFAHAPYFCGGPDNDRAELVRMLTNYKSSGD